MGDLSNQVSGVNRAVVERLEARLAAATRRAEEAERERDEIAGESKTLQRAINHQEGRCTALEAALRYIEGQDVAGMEPHQRAEDVARAVLADSEGRTDAKE